MLLLKNILRAPGMLLLSLVAAIYRLYSRQRVWLISDRIMQAGDNGEALFRYLNDKKVSDEDRYYFIVSNRSACYSRMKEIGRVVNFNSFKHRLLFVASDFILSSHYEKHITHPFSRFWMRFWRRRLRFKFIFLQHGVIKDDMSDVFNGRHDIDMFVTSSQREYESVSKYDLAKGVVKLTGLPRYDYLENNPENEIVVAPTHRLYLLSNKVSRLGKRGYSSEFRDTEYFKFYNRLINDERLLAAMKEKGMRGKFILHPLLSNQIEDFQDNEHFTLCGSGSYGQLLSGGNVWVSDYSSATFDFAYLGKPVVYAQFDRDRFRKEHTYRPGYFDYEKDGFGPVCYDYESTVREMLLLIKGGCNTAETYRQRSRLFFAYHDRRNCARVYDSIVSL